MFPQSEIQKLFGDVDPATGVVLVRNKNPTVAGYAGDATVFQRSVGRTDENVRALMGIDNPDFAPYRKYYNDKDPLFAVRFGPRRELDVPIPQDAAKGTRLGNMNHDTHHVPGTGKTKGGVPEGVLPRGTETELVDIFPVGTPRASYPPVPGAAYAPYKPVPQTIRQPLAPLMGATAGLLAPGPDQEKAFGASGDAEIVSLPL